MFRKIDFFLTAFAVLSIAGCVYQFSRIQQVNQTLFEEKSHLVSIGKELAESQQKEPLDCEAHVLKFPFFRKKVEPMMRDALAQGKKPALVLLSFGNKDVKRHGLKYVNDTYGHLNSRKLILSFVRQLWDMFPEEQFIVGYRGGSNFMVYSADYGSRDELVAKIRNLVEKWHNTPFQLTDNSATITDLVCYALICIHGETGDDPLQFFDIINRNKESVRKLGDTACVVLPYKE